MQYSPRFTPTGERLALAFDAGSKPTEDPPGLAAPLCDRLAAVTRRAIATAARGGFGSDLLLILADASEEAAIELRLAGEPLTGDLFALHADLLRQFAPSFAGTPAAAEAGA